MKKLILIIILLLTTSVYADWPSINPSDNTQNNTPVNDWPPLNKEFVKLPPLTQNITKKITGYQSVCTPNGCQQVPVYEEVEEVVEPIGFDQAVDLLSKGNLSFEDSKRLERIIDDRYRKDVVNHKWSGSTCSMLDCRIHGAQYYDIHRDGTETISEEQPQGYDYYSQPRRFRIFNR